MEVVKARDKSPKPPIKLVVASCFYEVKAYSPYIVSLLNSVRTLDELGIPWDFYELSGDSYVDRAKNSLVHRFLQDPDATHLFMVDSDEAWDVEGFARLIRAILTGAEVVGGAYPCKNMWEFFGCYPKTDEHGNVMVKDIGNARLLEMDCIPGGFIVYSRQAFERTRPKLNSYGGGKYEEGPVTEFFRCNVEPDGTRIGEDIYFQRRYQEMGGIVWLEPDITIMHFGVKAWTGNYLEHLKGNKMRLDKEQQEASKCECA